MSIEIGRVRQGINRVVNPTSEKQIAGFKEKMTDFGVRVDSVDNLAEIFSRSPFTDSASNSEKPVAICDIHGVLTRTLDGMSENSSRAFWGLRKLARKTDMIIFFSSSINLGSEEGIVWQVAKPVFGGNFPKWPFITNEAMRRLEGFVKKANPDCKTELAIGITDKLFRSGNKIIQLATAFLQENRKIVAVGSSFTDRNMIKGLAVAARERGINLAERLYYFDTGRRVL